MAFKYESPLYRFFISVRMDLLMRNKLLTYYKLDEEMAQINFLVSQIDLDNIPETVGKECCCAMILFEKGKSFFEEQEYSEAIQLYNQAIEICPHETKVEKEYYLDIITERCGVYCLTKNYEAAYKDIEYLERSGSNNRKKIIRARKRNILQALNKNPPDIQTSQFKKFRWTSSNKQYPALSEKVTVKQNKKMGRFLVATSDIRPGEIVGAEEPYVYIVHSNSLCGHCANSVIHCYSCSKCTTKYCSYQCKERATSYHKYECNIYFYVDCEWLPLRMITKHSVKELIKQERSCQNKRERTVYNSSDYYNAKRLIVHDPDAEEELFNRVKVALWIKLLKKNAYFEGREKETLSVIELLVAKLLMGFILIDKYNSYYFNKPIRHAGSAIYSTLSLINHSCDPSVMPHSNEKTCILQAIKPIKAGQIVDINYCETYWLKAKKQRRISLNQYLFTCSCRACVKNWPRLADMDKDTWNCKCPCGQIIPTRANKLADLLSKDCPQCKESMKPVGTLVLNLITLWKDVDTYFKQQEYAKARAMLSSIVNAIFKLVAVPSAQVAMLQKRLYESFKLEHYPPK